MSRVKSDDLIDQGSEGEDVHVKITRNVGILMGMQLGMKGLDVLVSVILARYLAPEGFGLYAFALAFVSMFSTLPGFGMGTLTMRNLARDMRPLSQYLWNGLVAKLFLSLGTVLLLGLIMAATGSPLIKILAVVLAGLAMALQGTLRFTTSCFHAAQRMTTVAMVNLAWHLGWFVAALTVVGAEGGLLALLGVRALVLLTAVLGSVCLIHVRLRRLSWTFEPAFMWRLLKASFPFALIKVFVLIYMDIDMVMLSFLRGDVMTGLYAAAEKFWRLFLFIPFSFRDAVMPAMAKFSRESSSLLSETFTRNCRYLCMIALPIAGGIFVLADPLIVGLFGPAYAPAVRTLQVLIWAMPLVFVNNLVTPALGAVGRERQLSWCLGIGAAFNIAANLVVIPRWGHVGAAATTLLSHALVLLLQWRLLKRVVPHLRVFSGTLKPVVATGVMMAFAWAAREIGLPYVVVGSAAIYVGCLVASRAIGAEEWMLLNGVVRRG